MARRILKRPSRTRTKRHPKFPEIEALSAEERKELERYEMLGRSENRQHAIDDVVRQALIYDTETRREDPTHAARQSKAYWSLRKAIEYAFEAIHPGPITDEDLTMAKRLRDWARDTET